MEEHLEPTASVAETQTPSPEIPAVQTEQLQRSDELQKQTHAIEEQKQRAVSEQSQHEAAAADLQERINATLGTHDILSIVRAEDAALIAVYDRQLARMRAQKESSTSPATPDTLAAQNAAPSTQPSQTP